MGGIGKTWLSVKLTQQLQDQFEFVIWRSLFPTPLVNKLLKDLIAVLSDGKETDLPEPFNHRISRLIHYLQRYHCLLVLDGADGLLQESAAPEIRTKMPSSVSSQELLETLELLQARSWIDAKSGLFSLHPMMIEYVKSFIIDEKITKFQPSVFLDQEHQRQVAS